MKTISLHPFSVLVGVVLAGLVALSTGAMQAIPTKAVLVGEIPADWWTYVVLTPSQSFTVPSGRHFVVTSATLGSSTFADGQLVNTQLAGVADDTRVPFAQGTILTADNIVRLWGY